MTSPFEDTFPGFVRSCADLQALLVPWGFALLVLAFAYQFWASPPSPPELVRFLVKLFLIVLLIGQAHSLINAGQTVVARLIQDHVPARPENVAARYQEKLAEAQNAPQERDRSFLSSLFSSNWFEAIIFALLTLIAWLAMALMFFVYSVQRVILLVCWVLSPVLFATLAIPPLASLGLRHLLRILGIILWPLGLALAATFTDGLIDSATDQSFLATTPSVGWLGYGLQNLLAVTVIAIWIIFSSILAPVMIQRLIAGTPGPASVLTAAGNLVTGAGLPLFFTRFTRSGVHPATSYLSRLPRELSPLPRSPLPLLEPPFNPTTANTWQPRPHDPTGDQQVRGIVEGLKSP